MIDQKNIVLCSCFFPWYTVCKSQEQETELFVLYKLPLQMLLEYDLLNNISHILGELRERESY